MRACVAVQMSPKFVLLLCDDGFYWRWENVSVCAYVKNILCEKTQIFSSKRALGPLSFANYGIAIKYVTHLCSCDACQHMQVKAFHELALAAIETWQSSKHFHIIMNILRSTYFRVRVIQNKKNCDEHSNIQHIPNNTYHIRFTVVAVLCVHHIGETPFAL